jgi:hypothetical protein
MTRLFRTVLAAIVLTLTLTIPAQARVPRTVHWVCDVPDVGLVTFVTAAEAARHGIDTANSHAGQVFTDQFGEVCTVR